MSGVSGIVWLCLSSYIFPCLLVNKLYNSVTLVSLHLLQQHVMLARLAACSCLATGRLSMCHTQTPVGAAALWPHHNGDATVLQDVIIGLCSGSTALFTMGALREATTGFLTHLPQDSRAPLLRSSELLRITVCLCGCTVYKRLLTIFVQLEWFPCTRMFEPSLWL